MPVAGAVHPLMSLWQLASTGAAGAGGSMYFNSLSFGQSGISTLSTSASTSVAAAGATVGADALRAGSSGSAGLAPEAAAVGAATAVLHGSGAENEEPADSVRAATTWGCATCCKCKGGPTFPYFDGG